MLVEEKQREGRERGREQERGRRREGRSLAVKTPGAIALMLNHNIDTKPLVKSLVLTIITGNT